MKIRTAILTALLLLSSSQLVHSQVTVMPITFNWNHDGSTVTGFNLYRRDGQTGASTLFQTIPDPIVRTILVEEPIGQVYCYTLSAYLTTGTTIVESARSNEVCHASLTAPVLLRLTE